MAKGNFANIGKGQAREKEAEAFIETAKVDGNLRDKNIHSSGFLPDKIKSEKRRGKYRLDPETGEKILLGGKKQEVPLNAAELAVLTEAAALSGLTLTTFIRSEAVKSARRLLRDSD